MDLDHILGLGLLFFIALAASLDYRVTARSGLLYLLYFLDPGTLTHVSGTGLISNCSFDKGIRVKEYPQGKAEEPYLELPS